MKKIVLFSIITIVLLVAIFLGIQLFNNSNFSDTNSNDYAIDKNLELKNKINEINNNAKEISELNFNKMSNEEKETLENQIKNDKNKIELEMKDLNN